VADLKVLEGCTPDNLRAKIGTVKPRKHLQVPLLTFFTVSHLLCSHDVHWLVPHWHGLLMFRINWLWPIRDASLLQHRFVVLCYPLLASAL
jgi:hypothetical protein